MTEPLEGWIADLSRALGLDPALVPVTALLDLSRDAAHAVARPAAPMTTFLVGLAAGARGGSAEAIAEATAIAQHLTATLGPAS